MIMAVPEGYSAFEYYFLMVAMYAVLLFLKVIHFVPLLWASVDTYLCGIPGF